MDRQFKVNALKEIDSEIHESVKNPEPKFQSSSEALQFYVRKLEQIAQQKN